MGRRSSLKSEKQLYPQHAVKSEGKVIRLKFKPQPKSESQKFYIDSLYENKLTIGAGPAGSGKSFLAMAVALDKLTSKEVQKIVITRPIVEAGEKLGFLPGTFEEKISPYLLPLLDAVEDLVGPQMAKTLLENGSIEFAPLAYMRGRTFNNAFVILDEAQNTTIEQMKLFITRIGERSQFVVNGDQSQSDLTQHEENGLAWIVRKLQRVSRDIQVVNFSTNDVVRSEIVKLILEHLEKDEGVERATTRHSFHEPSGSMNRRC